MSWLAQRLNLHIMTRTERSPIRDTMETTAISLGGLVTFAWRVAITLLLLAIVLGHYSSGRRDRESPQVREVSVDASRDIEVTLPTAGRDEIHNYVIRDGRGGAPLRLTLRPDGTTWFSLGDQAKLGTSGGTSSSGAIKVAIKNRAITAEVRAQIDGTTEVRILPGIGPMIGRLVVTSDGRATYRAEVPEREER